MTAALKALSQPGLPRRSHALFRDYMQQSKLPEVVQAEVTDRLRASAEEPFAAVVAAHLERL